MVLRTAGSVLVVFLWSVTVVLGQYGWSVTYTTQSICTLKGSSVEMSCSYKYPSGHKVTSTFWFTKMKTGVEPEDIGQDPEYAGRLEYHGDKKKDCTLRITDLRERDSATYKFRFTTDQTEGRYYGDPGVTLSVTALQVKVTPSHWSQWKKLTCKTTSYPLTGNPTYTWYKNGQVVTVKTSTYSVIPNDKDSYSCAVKGHEDLHSPAVYKPKNTSVSVSPSGEIVEGSSVTLTCSSDANPPVDKYTWYFQNETFLNGFGQIYNISKFKSKDNGHYHCEAQNGRGSRNSTALMIILPGVSSHSGHTHFSHHCRPAPSPTRGPSPDPDLDPGTATTATTMSTPPIITAPTVAIAAAKPPAMNSELLLHPQTGSGKEG
ncbi:sialic acid-binding Ig-like lectin 14 [Salvelinus alpinus]|uniref:sialic acid-binding Ig-like lectin 14 n=1 Tax=Salvelinus alpinus TaxID=8036 RepID=UPI0039FDAA8D